MALPTIAAGLAAGWRPKLVPVVVTSLCPGLASGVRIKGLDQIELHCMLLNKCFIVSCRQGSRTNRRRFRRALLIEPRLFNLHSKVPV